MAQIEQPVFGFSRPHTCKAGAGSDKYRCRGTDCQQRTEKEPASFRPAARTDGSERTTRSGRMRLLVSNRPAATSKALAHYAAVDYSAAIGMNHFKHCTIVPGTIDSHCHLTVAADRGVPVAEVVSNCFESGMAAMLDIAIQADDLPQRRRMVGDDRRILFSAGVHPAQAADTTVEAAAASIRNAAGDPAIVAIGETGLDWYRGREHAAAQHALFEAQITLANELDLPLIVHNRHATEDIYTVLRQSPVHRGGIMHCYSAGPEWVASFVDLGFAISFAGNLTFPRSDALRAAAALVPPDSLLVETDAPFLAPVPARGRPNHPGYLGHTLCALAELRREPLEELAHRTRENFLTLFPRARSRLTTREAAE